MTCWASVADRLWDQASDLVFKPWFANDNEVAPPQNPDNGKTIPVLVSGDYRLGQTFKAERENLAGIWVPILRSGTSKQAEHFVFHLTQDTSVPLAPLSPTMQRLRRFAKYWDLVANSGNFVETTPRIWDGRDALPRVQADRQVGPTKCTGKVVFVSGLGFGSSEPRRSHQERAEKGSIEAVSAVFHVGSRLTTEPGNTS